MNIANKTIKICALLAPLCWASLGHAIAPGSLAKSGCRAAKGVDNTVSAVQSEAVSGLGTYRVSLPRPYEHELSAMHPVGTSVEVVRCLPAGRMVQIATGRIERVTDSESQATVHVPEQVAAQDVSVTNRTLVMHRNLYWQPMKGDIVRVLTPKVKQVQAIWPRFDFQTADIFETVSGDEDPFLTLAPEGREKLVQAFENLERFNGRFLIESESFEKASRAKASELTQMRAGMVANFLSRVFGIDSNRFVIRGKGKRLVSGRMISVKPTTGSLTGADLKSMGTLSVRILKD